MQHSNSVKCVCVSLGKWVKHFPNFSSSIPLSSHHYLNEVKSHLSSTKLDRRQTRSAREDVWGCFPIGPPREADRVKRGRVCVADKADFLVKPHFLCRIHARNRGGNRLVKSVCAKRVLLYFRFHRWQLAIGSMGGWKGGSKRG